MQLKEIIDSDNNSSTSTKISAKLDNSTTEILVTDPHRQFSIPMEDKCTKFENPIREDEIIYEDYQEKCIEKVQNLYVFKYDKNGNPSVILGPHWMFFASVIIIILSLNYIFYSFVFMKLTIPFKIVMSFLTLFHLIMFLMTSLSNPGLPSNDLQDIKDTKLLRYCVKCSLWTRKYNENKTLNSVYHCPFCDICIEGYDHHCPWTSKCIGRNNLIVFWTFIISTFVLLIGFMLSSLIGIHQSG